MSYPQKGFSLRGIIPGLRDLAKDAARHGDLIGIFCRADSNDSLFLFLLNKKWFSDNGLYEKALLAAWTNQKCVPHNFDPIIKNLLRAASREKLMRHSDPLPVGDKFTVYRGVQKGAPRGVSWTLDPLVAREFAGDIGVVYKTVVKRSDVYAYLSDITGRCGEKEILLVLPDEYPIESERAAVDSYICRDEVRAEVA